MNDRSNPSHCICKHTHLNKESENETILNLVDLAGPEVEEPIQLLDPKTIIASFIFYYIFAKNSALNSTEDSERVKFVVNIRGEIDFKNLNIVCVKNVKEALEILKSGKKIRRILSTTMNDRSSPSHCICKITYLNKESENETILNLVDLAGLEVEKPTRLLDPKTIRLSFLDLYNEVVPVSPTPGLHRQRRRGSRHPTHPALFTNHSVADTEDENLASLLTTIIASSNQFQNVTDMVVMLLETPFRRWHSDNKNDLLKVGKPIPILSALAPDKKLSKVFCRSFNPNLYQQHS
ncbi:hypothetical protein QTP88_027085 [Uroleucon formosanum]